MLNFRGEEKVKIKLRFLFLVNLLILGFSIRTFATIGPNLLSNPGFEQGLSGWSGDGELDNQEAHSGSYSVRMEGDSANNWNVFVSSRLELKRGQKYQLGVWSKVRGEGNISIGIRNISKAGVSKGYLWYTIPVKEQETWFPFDLEITTTPDPDVALFQIYLRVDQFFVGEVWFDDVSIKKIDTVPPNTPESFSAKRSVGAILLSWQPPNPARDGDIAEGGYHVYRSFEPLTEPDPRYFLVHTMNTTWVDLNVSRSPYFYLITALDDVGNESLAGASAHVLGAASASGRVRDQFGRPLEKVRVEILNIQEVETDENGMFYFPLIAEGEYVFRISKVGYRWQKETRIVEVDSELYFDFILIEDNVKPPKPVNLEISDYNPGMLILRWEQPPDLHGKKIAGFNIYRSASRIIDLTTADLVAELVEGLTWADLEVEPERLYWYAISLVDTALIESSLSESLSGVAIAPPKPINISPEPGEKNIDSPLIFSWSKLQNVEYYELELSKDEFFAPQEVLVLRAEDNSYLYKRTVKYQEGSGFKTDEIGLPDGEWFWRVRAVYLNGVKSQKSEPSSLVSINTKFNINDPKPELIDIDRISKGRIPFAIPYFGVQPAVLTKEQKPTIELMLNSPGPVRGEIRILDSAGKNVCKLYEGVLSPGLYTLPWDGIDSQGRVVRNGLYVVQVIVYYNNQRISSAAKVIVFR